MPTQSSSAAHPGMRGPNKANGCYQRLGIGNRTLIVRIGPTGSGNDKMSETAGVPVDQPDQRSHAAFWPQGWWRIVDIRIGIIPLPVYVLLVLIIVGFDITGTVPSDILMGIALLA